MRNIQEIDNFFIDSELNQQFKQKGYVKLQLFSLQEVEDLKAFFKSVENEHNLPGVKFHTTLNSSNAMLIQKTNDFVMPFFEKKLKSVITNYKLTIAGFLAKESGENTEVPIHQDWTFVDEDKFTSFNIWVSLDETNHTNGNLKVIPGSHLFAKTLRVSPNIPFFFEKFTDIAEKYLVNVKTKAGECVIFNQAIIHSSVKNLSGKTRLACIVSGFSEKADMLHFYHAKDKGENIFEKYLFSIDSMLKMKKNERPPEAELLETFQYSHPEISKKEFRKLCNKHASALVKIKNLIL